MTRLVATRLGLPIASMDAAFGDAMLKDFIHIANYQGATGYHTEPYATANWHSGTCDCLECW